MTRQTRNCLAAFALAIPPALVALVVSLPETYWL